MVLPVIDGVVRAAVVGYTASGGPWTNVWHLRHTPTSTPPTIAQIDAAHALFVRMYSGAAFGVGAPWFNAVPTAAGVSRIDYTVLDGSALGYTRPFIASGAGGAAASPAEVAAVLTLRTNTRGRRYRGRIYLPQPASGSTIIGNDGKLSSTILTAVPTQAQGLQTALQGISWAIVVASYGKSLIKDPNDKYDKIEVTWTPFATDVTTFSMDGVLDVIRNRKS